MTRFWILLIAAFVSGCDYEFKKPAETNSSSVNTVASENKANAGNEAVNSTSAEKSSESANSNTSGTATEGEKLVLSSTAAYETIPCMGREVEITEEATANNYVFTGECKKLTVDGVSNKITVEKVGEIVVTGISNKVAYGEGLGGKKPKIKTSGKSTIVETIKSRDEKAAEVK